MLREYLLNSKTREPNEQELSYLEYSITKMAKRNALSKKEYIEILLMHYKAKGINYGIDIWEDFARLYFTRIVRIHFMATQIFCDYITKDEQAVNLLTLNTDRVLQIFGTGEMDENHFKQKAFDFLTATPFFINFDSDLNSSAGIADDVENRTLFYSIGLSDMLAYISQLVTYSNTTSYGNQLTMHNNLGHFRMYIQGQSAYTDLLNEERSLGKDGSFAPTLTEAQILFAADVQTFSEMWVLFHEYAHLFLGDLVTYFANNHREYNLRSFNYELICDSIATRIMVKFSDVASLASNLALYILYYSNDSSETREESSHPSILNRLTAMGDLLKEAFGDGLNRLNNLTEIPHQFLQHRFYMKETHETIGKRIDNFFAQDRFPKEVTETAEFKTFLSEIKEKGFSLPVNSHEHLTTIIKDNEGNFRQLVYVKTTTLYVIFSNALANLLWPANSWQFGLNFLSLIFSLADGLFKIPAEPACYLFGVIMNNYPITREQLQSHIASSTQGYSRDDLEAGFQELLQLGIIGFNYDRLEMKDMFMEINPY